MKQITFLLMVLMPFCLQAQKVLEQSWPLASGKAVNLKLDHAQDIQLKGWDSPEVKIKAVIQVNGGRYNDAITLTADQRANELALTSVLDEKKIGDTANTDCDGQQSSWQQGNGKNRRTVCLEVTYEVWIPKNAAVNLKTISGNVTATNLKGALNLYSISGFIDVSLPERTQADFWLKSITGELYTNLDLAILNKKDEIPIVGYEMLGKVGEGGTDVRLETISSNIYLRKE